MSKLKELIERLCPLGVPHMKFGDVLEFRRGQTITEKDSTPGEYPVIAGGQKPAYYHNKYNRNGETIAVAGSGAYAGYVSWWTTPIFLSDAFSVHPKDCKLLPKYVYYYMVNIQQQIHNTKKGSGVPHVHGSSITNFLIPVPPIEVQEEIVKILDRFSDYAAELQAELQARKEQYEYYRNLLLSFNPSAYGCGTDGEQEMRDTGNTPPHLLTNVNVIWKTIGEICKVIQAPKKLKRKDYDLIGKYPIIDQGQEYVIGYSNQEDALLPEGEYVLFGDHTRNVKYFKGQFIQGADGVKILKTIEGVRTKYLYQIMKNLKIEDRGYNRHWTVVTPILIPIPPLMVQEKIVAILDRFETLVNDLTKGLPAEIAAVKEQYEYYRNKLLTFKQRA